MTNATVGDRELPIYCVDTTENKVALSFDAAWGVDSIIDTVCNHKALGPGAIILCHNGAKYTAEALDTMLTQLEEKGYTIVPISELIMRENYHMDVSGKQIADE